MYREVGVFARGLQLIALAAMVAAAGMTAPAPAQEKGPFGGFKHDSTAPIEIVADSLEVRQAENLAIFSGEVVAGQGTLRLTTDLLTVTYAAEEPDTGTDTNSRVGTGEIQHMRADGNVFLSNGDETAQGAWAEYDLANGMLRMGGNVVLTQGDNAISGESLVIDLNAGTGHIEGGRVKSVFAPAAKAPAAETPAAEN
jgi:lipopolysaccharide export system protein LptA